MSGPDHRIATFLDAMAAERDAARNTLLSYGRDLGDFDAWLSRRGVTLIDAGKDQITAYLASCEADGLSKSTRARRLSSLGCDQRLSSRTSRRASDRSDLRWCDSGQR